MNPVSGISDKGIIVYSRRPSTEAFRLTGVCCFVAQLMSQSIFFHIRASIAILFRCCSDS